MKSVLVIFVLLINTAAADSARADIYRLDGDDETISFTDTPNDKRFQLVIKDNRARKNSLPVTRLPKSEKNTGTAATPAEAVPAPSSLHLPIQGRITSPLGLRSDPFDGKLKHHNGLDIAAPLGTPVKPVAPGRVIFSGWKSGYGNTVILDHNDGMVTVYAHHASNSVQEGTVVGSDTVIAHSGSSGRSTGPHLHFEAWRHGVNISASFMPGSITAPSPASHAAAPINRYLQADGTLIFTNLR